jgi:hypothetical protein
MFKGATSFSQPLCTWGAALHRQNVNDMFLGSGCPVQTDPTFDTLPYGPFCVDCATYTRRPTFQPVPTSIPTGAPSRNCVEPSQYCEPVGQLCCDDLVCNIRDVCDTCTPFKDKCHLSKQCCIGLTCLSGKCQPPCIVRKSVCSRSNECCTGLACIKGKCKKCKKFNKRCKKDFQVRASLMVCHWLFSFYSHTPPHLL